jgi:hypothetical protein
LPAHTGRRRGAAALGGFKGCGQGSTAGAVAAVACAVADALRRRGGDIHELPATPERVLKGFSRVATAWTILSSSARRARAAELHGDGAEHVDVARPRRRLGLSQAGFARTVGLDVTALHAWEQGQSHGAPALRGASAPLHAGYEQRAVCSLDERSAGRAKAAPSCRAPRPAEAQHKR